MGDVTPIQREELVEADAVMQFLKMSRTMVMKRVREGRIPALNVGTKGRPIYRFRLSEIEARIQQDQEK